MNYDYVKQGDCLELMKEIPDGSIDMILCDLPYGCSDHVWDKIIDGDLLFREYKRICKQNANVILFCNLPFAKYLLDHSVKSEFSHCLIWVKNTVTRHPSCEKLPLSQYEMILCFRLNKYSNKNAHMELRKYFRGELGQSGKTVKEIKCLIQNKAAHHWFLNSSDFRIPTEANYRKLQKETGLFRRPYAEIRQEFLREKRNGCTYNRVFQSDVIKCGMTDVRLHPSQKPVALLELLIQAYSNPGETVLDNCMGSGSTCVAAINTGRHYIGFEKDPQYFEIAKRRIEEVSE